MKRRYALCSLSLTDRDVSPTVTSSLRLSVSPSLRAALCALAPPPVPLLNLGRCPCGFGAGGAPRGLEISLTLNKQRDLVSGTRHSTRGSARCLTSWDVLVWEFAGPCCSPEDKRYCAYVHN